MSSAASNAASKNFGDKTTNFKEIVENKDLTIWADVPIDVGIPPNKLAYVTSQPRIAALIAVQAPNGLWPVSKTAVERLKNAVERNQFDEAFVVLVTATGDFMKATPARH
jgi:hypothetical protein